MQYTTRRQNRQWANHELHGLRARSIIMSTSLVQASELNISLRRPFKIASTLIETCSTVLLQVSWEGVEAIGETAPFSRYGNSVASVIAEINAAAVDVQSGPFARRSLIAGLPSVARCGVDVLLHDLLGKTLDEPLFRLFGLDGMPRPVTSRTISIETKEEMLKTAMELRDTPILKLKVGLGGEYELISDLRSFYNGTIWLDANEGWTPDVAVSILRSLEPFDIELCEQPIPAGQPSALRYIRENSTTQIVADEDSVTAADLPALAGCVDGINVKLVKCGGLMAALDMIATARTFGFKVMLGSMVESEILSTAGAHIAPLVDWLDSDAPLLLCDSPFVGVTFANGVLSVPNAPGLGVRAVHDGSDR